MYKCFESVYKYVFESSFTNVCVFCFVLLLLFLLFFLECVYKSVFEGV